MIDRVIIESDEPIAEIIKALAKNGIELVEENGNLIATVHDSRDAEEEVTNLLNDAAIEAFVFGPDHDGRSIVVFRDNFGWNVTTNFDNPAKALEAQTAFRNQGMEAYALRLKTVVEQLPDGAFSEVERMLK